MLRLTLKVDGREPGRYCRAQDRYVGLEPGETRMILTHDPGTAAALLGPSKDWRPVPETSLPEIDRAIWAALGQRGDPWAQDAPDGFWRRLFLIDDAPRSQFDALRELLSRRTLEVPGPSHAIAALADTTPRAAGSPPDA